MECHKTLRGLALWFFFCPVRWAIQQLPWRWALVLGRLLGMVHALCLADQFKRRLYEGIQSVWGDELSDKACRQLVKRNLITRYKYLIDSFFYHCLDEDVIERIVPTVEGKAYLDGVLSSGQGAVLLTSHFGSFGLLIAGLAFRGYRISALCTLTPPASYRTWRWVERAVMQAKLQSWTHDRVPLVFWKPGMNLRPLHRRLLQGEVLVLYVDGARGRRFLPVDFMGYSLLLSAGPFRIAAQAHVPIIPAFIMREGDDSHRIVLEEPIVLKENDPTSLQQGISQYALLLAHYVRLHPDHWFTWARLRRSTLREDSAMFEIAPGDVEVSAFYTA